MDEVVDPDELQHLDALDIEWRNWWRKAVGLEPIEVCESIQNG